MSLIVWYQLNGSLENKGLANVTYTEVGGSHTWTAGKLDKCLTPSSRYYIISPITLGTEASICCWSKTTVNSKMTWVLGSEGYAFLNLFESSIYTLNIGDSNNNPFQDNSGNNINVLHDGNWHHFAVTFGSNVAKLYIDGEYRGKAKTWRSPKTTNNYIRLAGGFNGVHTYDWNGSLNDFRVYDHCLSAKEVKEISKGLILHYKLDKYQTFINQFAHSTFDVNSAGGGWSHWRPTDSLGGAERSTDKKYIYEKTQLNAHKIYCTAGSRYICYQSPAFNGGYRSAQAIIKMADCSVPDETKVNIGANAVTKSGKRSFTPLGDDFYLLKYEGFYQSGSDDLVCLTVYCGHAVYISEFYLENNTVTCTNIFDIKYNTNTLIDESGFEHNGSINSLSNATGNWILSNDTPRYKYCTDFNSNSVQTDLVVNNNVATLACWVKLRSYTSDRCCCIIGGIYLTIDSNGKLSGYAYGKSPAGYHNGTTTIPLNTWTHVAIVWTTTHIIGYVNGVEDFKIACTGNFRTSAVEDRVKHIGIELTSPARKLNGYLSDVRIYVTDLSAKDIQELYNNPVNIDNKYNTFEHEILEDNTTIRELNPMPDLSYTNYFTVTNNGYQIRNRINISAMNYTDLIPINPIGKTYYYDVEYSNTNKNHFYIGFEKFDSNKQSGSNQECQYIVNSTVANNHSRVTGTINLATANGHDAAYIKLRILNNWDSLSNGSSYIGTIHYISLKEVSSISPVQIMNTGVITGNNYIELINKSSISKTCNIFSNQFIEK